jgi:hypothetical protein
LIVWRKPIEGRPTENAAWLASVRRRIAPRLPIGERLLVAAPRYLGVSIRASVAISPGRWPPDVVKAIADDLRRRLDPMTWRLGRDLSAVAAMGWIRSRPGVARVMDLVLTGEQGPLADGVLNIPQGALPRLDDISIHVTNLEDRR